MIHAIQHGKAGRSARRSEDVLTSSVFGLLQAMPPQAGYLAWFHQARRIDGATLEPSPSLDAATFWPQMRLPNGDGCEPDLAIWPSAADARLGLIECKLYSGPSGFPSPHEHTEVQGQLGRQWLALNHGWRLDTGGGDSPRCASGYLVYVTADAVMPAALMESMCEETMGAANINAPMIDHLYWLSWRSLGSALEAAHSDDPVVRRLQAMLQGLLRAMGLQAYDGCPRPRVNSVPLRYGAWPLNTLSSPLN
jgi:hypothetical protein